MSFATFQNIPDCSRAEYVPVDELGLTELGEQRIKEGWKLENEWADANETQLLDGVYNKGAWKDEIAFLRCKYSLELDKFWATAVWTTKRELKFYDCFEIVCQAKRENNYDPTVDDFGIIAKYQTPGKDHQTHKCHCPVHCVSSYCDANTSTK